MGPCFQRPGFEKDGVLGNVRKHSAGMSLFREFAAVLHICWQTVSQSWDPLGLSPWPAAGRALTRPALRVAPKECPCGRPPAAQHAHSAAHPPLPAPGSEKASIQTESEKHYSSKEDKLTTTETNISVCRKKTRIENQVTFGYVAKKRESRNQ